MNEHLASLGSRASRSIVAVCLALAPALFPESPALAQPPAAPPPAAAKQPPPVTEQQPATSDATRRALAAALSAIERADYAAAESQFGRVTELEPEFPQGWLGLAEARLRLGRPRDALAAAKRANEIAPDLGATSFAVARCQAELGSHREALAELERALELEPDNVDALVLSSLVLRQLDRDEDATKLLEAAWSRGRHDPLLAEQLAFLRFDRGDAAGAVAAAQEALAADPERANLKLVLGFALAKDPARRTEAVKWLEEALAAGVAEPAQVRVELGAILIDLGRAADALPHLEEAARELPEASKPQYRLAQARRALGDEEGAQQALARFTELEAGERDADRGSKDLGIALNEAQTLANENRLAESLARLDALHAEHPDDSRVAALRAKVLFSMGRRREAEQSIADAVKRMPDRPEYQYLSGLFHMYAGRAVDAQAALERALVIDPELAGAHALLAGALVKQGKAEPALAHFQRAIDLGADAPEVRLGYAEALKTLGRVKDAELQMEAYRKLAASGQ